MTAGPEPGNSDQPIVSDLPGRPTGTTEPRSSPVGRKPRRTSRLRGTRLVAVAVPVVAVLAATWTVFNGTHDTPEPAPVEPSPVPRRTTNCIQAPHECGYPDHTNTGVPEGSELVKVPTDQAYGPGWEWDPRGWLSVTTDGTLLENIEVEGNIDVRASNVVLDRVKVTIGGDTFGISLRHTHNVTIRNSEISGRDTGQGRLMVGIKDIYGDSTGTQVLGNDISRTATGVQVYGGLIQDNYIHDLGQASGDHTNGTTDNGGSGEELTIRHNTVMNQFAQTDAISLFQDFGRQANRLIENNLVAGGGYSIYGGANPGAPLPTQIRIVNNRFARKYFPHGGRYGPVTAFATKGAGNIFSGNVWDDTNEPVGL